MNLGEKVATPTNGYKDFAVFRKQTDFQDAKKLFCPASCSVALGAP